MMNHVRDLNITRFSSKRNQIQAELIETEEKPLLIPTHDDSLSSAERQQLLPIARQSVLVTSKS